MAAPKTVTRVTKDKNGKVVVKMEDNVDRVNYTIAELTRAALNDSGKTLVKLIAAASPVRTGTLAKAFDKKVIKDKKTGQMALLVGTRKKKDANKTHPYARHAHLVILGHAVKGGGFVPGNNFPLKVAADNIPLIREVQAQYLSAIDDELKAMALIEKQEDATEDYIED